MPQRDAGSKGRSGRGRRHPNVGLHSLPRQHASAGEVGAAWGRAPPPQIHAIDESLKTEFSHAAKSLCWLLVQLLLPCCCCAGCLLLLLLPAAATSPSTKHSVALPDATTASPAIPLVQHTIRLQQGSPPAGCSILSAKLHATAAVLICMPALAIKSRDAWVGGPIDETS